MNHLLRSLAPISDEAWKYLDDEARQRSMVALAARQLVDFAGPHGWQYSATNLGRTSPVPEAPAGGVSARQRVVLPLVELRAEFAVTLTVLQDIDRGAKDADLGQLDTSAHQMAVAENVAVFHGMRGAMLGISEASPHPPLQLGAQPEEYPKRIAAAVASLRASGVRGPYGLALGPDQYRLVLETAEQGGYPLLDHLARITEGPIVWAPGVDGGVMVSMRGGDFLLEVGEDLSIGYASRDSETVTLYLEESLSFHVATPEAGVTLPA